MKADGTIKPNPKLTSRHTRQSTIRTTQKIDDYEDRIKYPCHPFIDDAISALTEVNLGGVLKWHCVTKQLS